MNPLLDKLLSIENGIGHFDTYVVTEPNSYWTDGCPDEVRNALPSDLRETYHKLEQGEIFHIE